MVLFIQRIKISLFSLFLKDLDGNWTSEIPEIWTEVPGNWTSETPPGIWTGIPENWTQVPGNWKAEILANWTSVSKITNVTELIIDDAVTSGIEDVNIIDGVLSEPPDPPKRDATEGTTQEGVSGKY